MSCTYSLLKFQYIKYYFMKHKLKANINTCNCICTCIISINNESIHHHVSEFIFLNTMLFLCFYMTATTSIKYIICDYDKHK